MIAIEKQKTLPAIYRLTGNRLAVRRPDLPRLHFHTGIHSLDSYECHGLPDCRPAYSDYRNILGQKRKERHA